MESKACTRCGVEKPVSEFYSNGRTSAYRSACKPCHRQRVRETRKPEDKPKMRIIRRQERRRLRQQGFDVYGHTCSCCGESNQKLLTFDHINGDGAAHRREVGNCSHHVLRDLRRRGWPPIVRVQCYNCNCGRQYNVDNPGVCPHEEQRLVAAA